MEMSSVEPPEPQQGYKPGLSQYPVQLQQPHVATYPVQLQQPQVATYPVNYQQMPNDYLVQSLIALFCCCWPIGIFALLQSLRVREAFRTGDLAGAQQASKSARQLSIAAVVSGVVLYVVIIIVSIVATVVAVTTACDKTNNRYQNNNC